MCACCIQLNLPFVGVPKNREGENGFIYRVLDNKGEENGHTATGNQTVTNDSENIIETEGR